VRRRLRAVLAGALLAAPFACAALEKCVSADGKVTYSDHGCAAGAKRTSVGTDASMSDAQIEYYDVEGRDQGSLLGSVNAHSGGQHGYATWFLSYQFQTRSMPGGCGVGSLTTKLELKVRLPRWSPPPDAAPGLASSWQRYLNALLVHENGHLQTGRDFEAGFKRAAASLSAPNCGAVSAALRASFETLLSQAQQRDRDYDAQTSHGATQGAVFR
jgi:predicted secreted Zn-dependent protease